MKISGKEAVSPVIGVILMVAITVVLAAVLYVWVSSMTTTAPITPFITMTAATSDTGTGYTQGNVTWTITSPSRADIKWADVPQTSAKFLDDGTAITPTAVTWPGTTYVSGGDTIKATFLRSAVTSGSIIKLILVYTPSSGTCGESQTTFTWVV